MTNNEKELLYIIRNHDNPEQALKIALDLMYLFLKQHEEPQCTSSENLRESA